MINWTSKSNETLDGMASYLQEPERTIISVLLERVHDLEVKVAYLRTAQRQQADQIRELMGISTRRDDDGK